MKFKRCTFAEPNDHFFNVNIMNKIVKRILLGLLIFIVLILAAAVIIPIAFKGKIVEYAKKEANTKINALVDFNDDISISIFSSFPNLTIEVKNLKIVNKAPFLGDTLISATEFDATLDIMSVLKGDKIQIKNISMDNPRIMAHVHKDGLANWSITFPSNDTLKKQGKDTSSNFKIGLKKYAINHGYIVYNDESMGMSTTLVNLNHSGSGDFTSDLFDLETKTSIDKTTFTYGGISYLSKVKTNLIANVSMDMKNSKYTLKDNELQLNGLTIAFSGFVAMPGKDINMDMSFKSKQTDFKSILSLIPAIYSHDFDKLKSSGTMAFNGEVKGTYNDKTMPGFIVNLSVDNGFFQYPDLPSPVKDVNIAMNINSPQGDMNNMVINIQKAHFAMAELPFDMHMIVKTPMTDPYVDGAMKGRIVLENVSKVVKLDEGTSTTGELDVDLTVKGHVSTLQNKKYEDFDASGKVVATNIGYASKDLPEKVTVSSATLTFNPKNVKLSGCKILLGKSDVSMDGSIDNMLGYMFRKNEVLHGTLSMNSSFFDVNPWMKSSSTDPKKPDTAKMSAVELPENIDFTFTSKMDHVVYDKWDITNMHGTLTLKDKKLEFNKVGLNMLGATFGMDGFYDTKTPSEPLVNMNLDIKNLSIPETYKNFMTVQKFAPIAKYMTGTMNLQMFVVTKLDKEMNPQFNSLNANGKLDIDHATITDFPALKELATQLKMSKLNPVVIKDIHPSFVITNGRFSLKDPLKFNVDKIKGTVSGSNGLDQTLDYVVAMDIPSGDMGSQANTVISGLAGKNLGVTLPKSITVDALIGGTFEKPSVKLSMKNAVAGVMDDLKKKAQDEFDKKKKETEDKAKAELDKQKQQLDAQKKQMEDQAKSKADAAKKQAEDQAKKQADLQKQNIQNQAKDKLKGLFGK